MDLRDGHGTYLFHAGILGNHVVVLIHIVAHLVQAIQNIGLNKLHHFSNRIFIAKLMLVYKQTEFNIVPRAQVHHAFPKS